MRVLLAEVERFRQWAASIPSERSGEWECNYENWRELHGAVLAFLETRPLAGWSETEMAAVLYVVARDNEIQYVAREIHARGQQILFEVASAASRLGEPDAKWQLAVELGKRTDFDSDGERILLAFAQDENEYVRRRALEALARIGSTSTEGLALEAWSRADPNQEWARMMSLWCLHRIQSPQLGAYLEHGEKDARKYLSEYAKKLRRGEVET